MKKVLLIATLSVFLVGLIACGGGGKYADAKALMEDGIKTFDTFAADMEKAGDAKAVAAAMTTFGEKMKEFAEKGKEMEKKYPDMKNNPPEELKELMEKFKASTMKMQGAMTKVMQYASDPAVAKAMEAMKGAM